MKLAGIIVGCIIAVVVAVTIATHLPTPTLSPPQDGVPVNAESAILGKWRHGLPEECPPSMDPRQYEEFRKLPENKTYYLEFLVNGNVLYISSEGEIVDGVYTFIGDDYVEIVWNTLYGTLAWELYGGHGVYEVQISGDRMALQGGTIGLDADYWRVN